MNLLINCATTKPMGNKTTAYFTSLIRESKEFDGREKEILIKRLENKKLQTIGRKYKITAERIRQIEERALHKFKEKIIQLRLLDQ